MIQRKKNYQPAAQPVSQEAKYRLKHQLSKINQTLLKNFQRKTKNIENVRLEEAMRYNQLALLGEISAGLTHEIVTPLTNIKVNLSMIKEHKSVQEEASTALLGVEQIDSLIQNYLKQINGYDQTCLFNPLDQIKIAERMLEFKIRKTGITLNIDFAQDAQNGNLFGNSTKFTQVIINLVKNATDAYAHFPEREKFRPVDIVGRIQKENLVIRIVDFGIGISLQNKSKIFEKFFTTKQKTKGTGLGLPICKEIIERDFKGRLKLMSLKTPTIFQINIPAKIPEKSSKTT